MSGLIDHFRQTITAAGLEAPPDIEPGRWHGFPGFQKSRGNKAAYCFMFGDMRGGVFGDYSTGMECNWQASNSTPYTTAEREAHLAGIKAMKAQRDAAEAGKHEATALDAARRFKDATPCTQHAYLTARGAQGHGVKVEADGFLIVPMRDTAGKLWNIERINPADSKDKRGLYGGRRTGLYHSIGKPAGVLIVCEGYATGASIHEATGHAVAVAFNAGNVGPVATVLHKKYAELIIVLAADDDWRTDGNPGQASAKLAALAVGGFVVVPQFPADRPNKATDFNDLAAMAGLSAVRACFSEIEVLSC